MGNDIDLVSKFVEIIDAVYKEESLTARLDAMTQDVPFAGANEVKVLKLSTVGLGNYSRATGYPAGDITAKWETLRLTAERGRAFSLDRMDNEETLGLVLGNLIREWMRVHVAPELDATVSRLRHGAATMSAPQRRWNGGRSGGYRCARAALMRTRCH